MPIYDYQCCHCSHRFEKLVRHNETPVCPSCQAVELERVVSAPGISTQKSRNYTHGIARKAANSVKKEQDHAQREYQRNYIKDHS